MGTDKIRRSGCVGNGTIVGEGSVVLVGFADGVAIAVKEGAWIIVLGVGVLVAVGRVF